jgi:guanylate kinase
VTSARLYIIDGVSSVWKEDLVHYVDHVIANGAMVRKFTTRTPGAEEDRNLLDLEFLDPATFAQVAPDYVYEYAGQKYGIRRSRLTAALSEKRNVFVIVRNPDIIRQLKADFALYRPTSVFVHMDMQLAANRGLAAKNALRREAVKKAFADYLRDPECYDQVLVNGGSQNDFFRLVGLLIKRASGSVLVLTSDHERLPLLIVSTRRSRRLLQTVLSVGSAAVAGFIGNMLTEGVDTYWEQLTLVLSVVLLLLTLSCQLLIATCWRERA